MHDFVGQEFGKGWAERFTSASGGISWSVWGWGVPFQDGFFFAHNFVVKNFKYTHTHKKLKELYSTCYAYHLDSTLNILPSLLYHISIYLSASPNDFFTSWSGVCSDSLPSHVAWTSHSSLTGLGLVIPLSWWLTFRPVGCHVWNGRSNSSTVCSWSKQS